MDDLIYLLTIRLVTLAIGAMTLYLGYRLLILQDKHLKTTDSGSVSANIGNAKIEMKNVAAGVFFSGFGAFLVVATLIANPPQIETTVSKKTQNEEQTITVTARGDDDQTIKQETKKLHQQAEALYEQKNIKAAYAIQESIILLQAGNDYYLETAANYAFEIKDCFKAISYIKQAISLQKSNSYYQQTLKKYQEKC